MTTWQLLTTAWDWEPSVLLGCGVLVAGYLWTLRRRTTWAAGLFIAGVLVLLVALVSPLDTLGDTYLFSMHMGQHLLLVLVVPPLMLLGVPAWLWERILASPTISKTEKVLRQPFVAWGLGTATLWAWHLP